METKIIGADKKGIEEAAAVIKAGAVVAFPTETVYGIGGDKAKILEIKGQRGDKPLTAHISDKTEIARVAEVTEKAQKLIDNFMPGAITLVLTGKGGGTIGVRLPDNETARELIRKCGGVLYATSANVSGAPAPATAEEVYAGLNGKIPLILDGGACAAGKASTVINLTCEPPVILRQGTVTKEQIEKVIGRIL